MANRDARVGRTEEDEILIRQAGERLVRRIATDLGKGTTAAVFGSQTSEETDVLFLADGDPGILSVHSVRRFCISLVDALVDSPVPRRLFLYNLHRGWGLESSSPGLHLLYYPSEDLLYAWESSSFLAYLFNYANVVSGDSGPFKVGFERYRSGRENQGDRESHASQPAAYAHIAVPHIVYARCSKWSCVPLSEAVRKLVYACRYMALELVRHAHGGDVAVGLLSKGSSLDARAFLPPSLLHTWQTVEAIAREASREAVSVTQADELFAAFCEFYNGVKR